MAETEARFPKKLAFLFQPARYKVARGGRGSGKSWGFARALLIIGAQKPTRVLCTREVQKSIQQSVHQLLKDQVAELGLSDFYEVLTHEIRGKNGSMFFFAGLNDLTVADLKSYEGLDVVWCEEAHSITGESWKRLIPTIRKDDSEIWVTFNPELDTDETYRRFITSPPPDCVSVEMNYVDNPWFPEVLEKERLHDERTLKPAEYAHTWLGRCKPAVAGAIYFDEVAAMEASGRIGLFPMDPMLKVHRIWDMGWNDAMAIILAQRNSSAVTAVGYLTGNRRTTADYVAEMREPKYKGWNWGDDWLPHDGFAKNRQTGKSDADVLTGLGCSVQQVPNMEVELGIRQARLLLPRLYIDKNATASADPDLPGLVECLKRYRRHVNQQTNTPGAPLHDKHSNGADATRYLGIVAERLTNESWGGKLAYPRLTTA